MQCTKRAGKVAQMPLCLLERDKMSGASPPSKPTNHKSEVSPPQVAKALGCSKGMSGRETALVVSTAMYGSMDLKVPHKPPVVQAKAPSAPPPWPCAPQPSPAPVSFSAHAPAPRGLSASEGPTSGHSTPSHGRSAAQPRGTVTALLLLPHCC